MKLLALGLALCLTGCLASSSEVDGQRFVLVADPSGIAKDIPVGALALDTQTGVLCYTVQGAFTSGTPGIGMCSELVKKKTGTGKE
jgi:hypothetical protein